MEGMFVHLTDPEELQRLRQRRNQFDVDTVPGTRFNHHHQFLGAGKLRFRWLACSCFACREGLFDGCLNVRYIAHWTMFEFSRAVVDGIGQRRLRRFNLAKEIWESVQKTNIVAVFNSTTDDASLADRATPTRPYWLATVCH